MWVVVGGGAINFVVRTTQNYHFFEVAPKAADHTSYVYIYALCVSNIV